MERILYIVAFCFIKGLQALPLSWVARLGRAAGGLAYRLDGRHRRVAEANLKAAFGDAWTDAQVRATAKEHFRRLGESYASAIKTSAMSDDQLLPHLEVTGVEHLLQVAPNGQSLVFVIGHFGNFELYARGNRFLSGYTMATTYRPLRPKSIDDLFRRLRTRSGLLMFDRRSDADALRQAVRSQPIILGLFSDQHAGRSGAWVPFFGRPASTTRSPALYAMRFRLPLLAAICYRTGPARWRIEVSPPIATRENGTRRSPDDVMAEVNRLFEEAVRRDPPNWFWVHQRWKPFKQRKES